MRPRVALQRPLVTRIFFAELLCRRGEHRVVVSRLVLTDSAPVDGLGRDRNIPISLGQTGKDLLCVQPLLAHEGDARQPNFQTRAEPVCRQVAFKAITFLTVRVCNENRRRPNRVEALEPCGMLFDMGFERDECLVDEAGGFLIAVGLGLQPSTSTSSGGGGKIYEHGLVFRPGPLKRGVNVLDPIDEHRMHLVSQF